MSMVKMDPNPPNPLGISWYDSAWMNILDSSNVLEYFSDRSNPFYDRTCNNETVKMQRADPEVLHDMTGLEYILLHVQEPVLYIIRKQHRHSRTQVTPQADYYVLAGVVYQAPDLNTALNSRLLSTVYHLQGAFELAHSFNRYHPSKGYWWDFGKEDETKKDKGAEQKESASQFQRRRVDLLLGELARKYPPKIAPPPPQQQPPAVQQATPGSQQPGAASAGAAAGNATQNGGHSAAAPQSNGATTNGTGGPGGPNHKAGTIRGSEGPNSAEKKPRLG